jgi:hypothetical protein
MFLVLGAQLVLLLLAVLGGCLALAGDLLATRRHLV